MKEIHLWGAKQNNLKNVEIKVPLGSYTVVCGPSGSGKSSLAFETLYAEGQRRYIESLSNYTKQFLNKAPKPDVEGVENIPPAVAIEQKNAVKSSRSTVGTTTEVVDYMRLLFEKAGHAYCPYHHITLEKESVTYGAQKVIKEFSDDRGYILAPIFANERLLTGKKLQEVLLKEGYLRIYVPPKKKATRKKKAKKTAKKKTTKKILQEAQDNESLQAELLHYSKVEPGQVLDLQDKSLAKKGVPKEDFYIVIDRLVFRDSEQDRIADSLAQAYEAFLKYNHTHDLAQAEVITVEGRRLLLSEDNSCSVCGYKFPPITSALFSFNSPVGACETCKGFGNILEIDEDKVVPNPDLSIAQGALHPFAMPSAKQDRRELNAYCKKAKIDVHTPWKDLPAKHKKAIWEGNTRFFGVLGLFEYLETKKYKMHVRVFLSRFKSPFSCPDCKGSRLVKEAQQVLIKNHSISDLSAMTVESLRDFMEELTLPREAQETCEEPLRQIRERLRFMNDVGVGYLTLDRATRTLSGGEYQRLNLANQLGMGLSQTLYVLDEPTVGLHPRDNDRLISILKRLNEIGNTLVVVEHDHDVIKNSNFVIEMGPGSGHLGGEVIYEGATKDFYQAENSNTVGYLQPSSKWTALPDPRPVEIDKYRYVVELKGAKGNNLKNVDVKIPLNRLVTVTGVSGSGKSTLISQTLYPAIARKVGTEYIRAQEYDDMTGAEHVKNVILIDQSPIGKTARSNPVTYLKVYDAIRQIMASTNEARARGYTPGTFSLNVDGGRCPVCKGLGYEVVDMVFMDDIQIQCEACDGKRFRPEVLDVTYMKKNIHEILSMTVAEAMEFFVAYPNIRRPLSILKEVGLDYLTLGQSANSLSGGESQRLKVARELNATHQRATMYIMDEPTTGLHFREVHLLLKVLNKLIEAGGSVILIEHNLEIIKNSDYIIDLGPEAGAKGGRVVNQGTPEELMKGKKGYTGKYLKEYIEELSPEAANSKRKKTRLKSSNGPAARM